MGRRVEARSAGCCAFPTHISETDAEIIPNAEKKVPRLVASWAVQLRRRDMASIGTETTPS